MFSFLKRKSEKAVDAGQGEAPFLPQRPLYVIGDIHGRADLLATMLEKIDHDIGERDLVDPKLVFVGDFVDRGEQSAEVLVQVRQLWDDFPGTVVALKGNHEEMMLNFLRNPAKHGGRWLRYGGLQALASYGIGGLTDQPSKAQLEEAAEALEAALPDGMADWLTELPTLWASGNIIVTHAGINPADPIDAQQDRFLIWGHPTFLETRRADPLWVVHGHTIVDVAEAREGRISVDTGAYFTGRLTAARIEEGGVAFLSTLD